MSEFKYDNVTLIIQGSLNEMSLSNIENYRGLCRIVISCWTNNDFTLFEKHDVSDVDLVVSQDSAEIMPAHSKERYIQKYRQPIKMMPNNIRLHRASTWNVCNAYRQVKTILEGVRVADTEFCIKVRSDQSFSDISYFIDKTISAPNKMTCIDLGFTCDNFVKYGIGDHIIGCRTDEFHDALTMMKMHLERASFARRYSPPNPGYDYVIGGEYYDEKKRNMGFEPQFGQCYLLAKGITPDCENSKKLVMENFNIVSHKDLGKFYMKEENIERYTQLRLSPAEGGFISSFDEL